MLKWKIMPYRLKLTPYSYSTEKDAEHFLIVMRCFGAPSRPSLCGSVAATTPVDRG